MVKLRPLASRSRQLAPSRQHLYYVATIAMYGGVCSAITPVEEEEENEENEENEEEEEEEKFWSLGVKFNDILLPTGWRRDVRSFTLRSQMLKCRHCSRKSGARK